MELQNIENEILSFINAEPDFVFYQITGEMKNIFSEIKECAIQDNELYIDMYTGFDESIKLLLDNNYINRKKYILYAKKHLKSLYIIELLNRYLKLKLKEALQNNIIKFNSNKATYFILYDANKSDYNNYIKALKHIISTLPQQIQNLIKKEKSEDYNIGLCEYLKKNNI
jgi:hypothetical protein